MIQDETVCHDSAPIPTAERRAECNFGGFSGIIFNERRLYKLY
jgi:hypothetical protein